VADVFKLPQKSLSNAEMRLSLSKRPTGVGSSLSPSHLKIKADPASETPSFLASDDGQSQKFQS
jgi:hypothetical protein